MLKTGFQERVHFVTLSVFWKPVVLRTTHFPALEKKTSVNVLMSFLKDYVSKASNNRIITRGATFKSENWNH